MITPKAAAYETLAQEVAAVLEGESDVTARMAAAAALIAQAFPGFLWTGFYRVDPARPAELVAGPYQGRLGCSRIAFGHGVCGQAAERRETLIVPDVHAFPGHIACDARARSEIVVPVFGPGGDLLAVIDVDSATPAAFDAADARGLEAIAALIAPPRADGPA